jgi:hypothetical protein
MHQLLVNISSNLQEISVLTQITKHYRDADGLTTKSKDILVTIIGESRAVPGELITYTIRYPRAVADGPRVHSDEKEAPGSSWPHQRMPGRTALSRSLLASLEAPSGVHGFCTIVLRNQITRIVSGAARPSG